MVGTTAQIAALTCHLNARKRKIATPRFIPGNSTCQFCEFIRFLRPKRGWFGRSGQWQVEAGTADEWLDSVGRSDFTRAVLVHNSTNAPDIADRMTAGFVAGGGRWLLCVQGGDLFDCWEADWQVGNSNAADRRIWRVQYSLVGEQKAVQTETAPVGEVTEQLAGALTEIESFARKQDLSSFADCFAKAQQCLVAESPWDLVYHRDLAPEGVLSLRAARLLAACHAAWVFGGMGSWNDLGFDGLDQDVYEKLSDQLYNLLNEGICASVNASGDDVQ